MFLKNISSSNPIYVKSDPQPAEILNQREKRNVGSEIWVKFQDNIEFFSKNKKQKVQRCELLSNLNYTPEVLSQRKKMKKESEILMEGAHAQQRRNQQMLGMKLDQSKIIVIKQGQCSTVRHVFIENESDQDWKFTFLQKKQFLKQ